MGLDLTEILDCVLELSVDLVDRLSQGLPLGPSELDFLELLKLHDSIGQVVDVVGSLKERVQPHK